MPRPSQMAAEIDLAADVLVLGGGPAGAWAALAAAEAGARVVLADKGRVGTSGASAAANTAVIAAPDAATRAVVMERRLARGFGLVQAETVERVLDEAHGRLLDLGAWGYAFARDDAGAIYRGTLRGPDYLQLLRRRLHKAGVRILDHSPALALIGDRAGAAGAWGVARAGGARWRVRAGAVVIATGGCAFRSKALGTHGLTGDGLLMAAELGATLSGMEFSGQYGISHVAATVTKNLIYGWASFTDATGRRLEGEDPFEILARHLPEGPVYAMIDRASPAIREGLRRGQPNIFLPLDRLGIDPFTERFPVTLRYEGTVRGVGGLSIDPRGATGVPGLFAAGDAASRESLVGATSGGGGPNATWAIASGCWAGAAAAAFAAGTDARPDGGPVAEMPLLDDAGLAEGLRLVQDELFPVERNFIRDGAAMRGARQRLGEGWRRLRRAGRAPAAGLDAARLLRGRELAAITATARWINAAALARTESRGIHRRRDCAATDPAQARSLSVSGLDHPVATKSEAVR
ncbi:FAD-binding protein [Labrys wisconsinensis]|uniref:L-aspartate oxidase n=1 Tax=Labrys wisconsinensis TaxID=425677 RepID=A0ABU0JJJ4_9HYPH|nr:FAD-binding protein [Labrys wisconsinensis]MDQ0474457.1 succinate dehydrogenase/fumarate reductase flavoprotein subunit [Labrys wisconsinensis]